MGLEVNHGLSEMSSFSAAFEQGWQVIAGVCAILGAGVVLRKRLSGDKLDRIKNEAEASIFTSHVGEIRLDRDKWQASATEGWIKVRTLEVENAVLKVEVKQLRSQMKLQARLIRRYPELSNEFTSGPGDLDSRPAPATPYVLPLPDDSTG